MEVCSSMCEVALWSLVGEHVRVCGMCFVHVQFYVSWYVELFGFGVGEFGCFVIWLVSGSRL